VPGRGAGTYEPSLDNTRGSETERASWAADETEDWKPGGEAVGVGEVRFSGSASPESGTAAGVPVGLSGHMGALEASPSSPLPVSPTVRPDAGLAQPGSQRHRGTKRCEVAALPRDHESTVKQWKQKEWRRFEHEVRDLVEAFGYSATTTQASHDYGVDVFAEHSRRRVIVQCKLYGRARIPGAAIMQLVGAREHFKVDDAVCITTGRFTRQARKVADLNSVHLIDGETLVALCRHRRLTIPSLTVLESGSVLVPTDVPHITLGRVEGNTVVVPDPKISRQHAVIERAGLHLLVSDVGSSNGTWLNGERVTVASPLTYEDTIRIGDTLFHVRLRSRR
jgi:hypothetical protein